MIFLLAPLAVIIIIGLLVFVHELGHFMAAKFAGVTVEEFALGFGPRLFAHKFKGTLYRVNLLPLGGYVKLEGERGEQGSENSPNSYANKPYRSKMFILAAGVTMNIIFAILLFMIYLPAIKYEISVRKEGNFNFIGAKEIIEIPPSLFISEIEPDSPAASVLKEDEIIIGINGQNIESDTQFTQFLSEHAGQEIILKVISIADYTPRDVAVTLRPANDQNQTLLGVGISFNPYTFYVIRYPENVLSSFPHAYNMFFYQIEAIGNLISQSISIGDIKPLAKEIGGLVVVSSIITDLISVNDILGLINLAAVVSLALAFANFLPIPLFDGGQAAIETVERIRGKKISGAIIERINFISLIFILVLFSLITLKDIVQVGLIDSIISGITRALGR